MENLKEGSVLEFKVGGKAINRLEVLAVLGPIVFYRRNMEDGKKGPAEFAEIEDMKTWGWTLKED